MVGKKKARPAPPASGVGGRADDGAEESAVGDRVRFDGPRWTGESGRLVADYAEFMVADGRLDRDWAPPRRWAVALDSGRLTFADDAELEPMTDGEDAQPSSVNE
ncbi:hypothetical protein [Rhodococcus sp. 05-340-1]|uniref:hypothetical protein n=1 Tax=Rhodococcus sp. 05-340-1 TaxID=2022505 RepID=UPI00117A7F29|nr:hypothetical protein [Rhodococcus sp. 05-340-1]